MFDQYLMNYNGGFISTLYQLIGLVGRVFANGPGRLGFNPRLSHTKDLKNGTWYHLA